MRNIFSFIKNSQKEIALFFGYILVALLFYQLGFVIASQNTYSNQPVEIIEPPITIPTTHNNENESSSQFDNIQKVEGITTDNCQGVIKGNIGSSGKIYHIPGGAFYERTDAEQCFETESEAIKAGFRKSKR